MFFALRRLSIRWVHRKHLSTASFTLVETIVALGLMTYLLLAVSGVQGNSVYYHQYGRRLTQATFLAKRVLSQIEYLANSRTFEDIKEIEEKGKFEEMPDFSYRVEIKNWKLPLLELLTGGGGGADGEKKEDGGGMMDMVKTAASQFLGDELLKTVKVVVSWAEGASQNKVEFGYLITNQRKVDEYIVGLKSVFDQINRASGGSPAATPSPGASPSPTPGGG